MQKSKRNLIKSQFPKATCRLARGERGKYFIVYLYGDGKGTKSVGKNPSHAWALAYDRLMKGGALQ